jgi:hypothetical protein
MASKKKPQLEKFCRIFQWIEQQDAEFAGAIRDLCLEGALSPGGRSAGVTFLYPRDKEYRREIVDAAYSAEADAAAKMIESLILPDVFLAAADWRRGAGSRAGVKYVVESADAGKVRLAGDVELALAEDFHPLARRAGDIAVWIVTKGRPPLTGDAYAPPSAAKKKRGADVTGGASGGAAGQRAALAAAVEAEFDRCMRADRCATHNPYLAKSVSLLNFLRAKSPETAAMVAPIVDVDPMLTFYLLLEPYKSTGAYLIPDSVLFGDGAWNGCECFGDAVREYEGHLAADAGAGRDRAAVAAQVDMVRQRISAGRPTALPALVAAAYEALTSRNSIEGMDGVLPEATMRALGGGKKLWQDELRFIIHAAFAELRTRPYDPSTFATIVNDLRTKWPGDSYGAELCLANAADMQNNVAPRSDMLALLKFVNSTDFLYVAPLPSAVGAAWGSMNLSDTAVYNRNAVALADLRRYGGMVRASGVSASTMRELEIYAQANGKLPDEVVALAAKP